jgi:acyl-CoA reductase-like NAD-dependent aldehyde dehydrogenase
VTVTPIAARPIAREVPDLHRVFQLQQHAFRRHPNPSARERRAHLDAVCRLLRDHGDDVAAAIGEDFGHRSRHETRILEIFPALQAAKHARARVAAWMRTERRPVAVWFFPGRARVVKQPLGVIGIIVPWNYPLFLSVAPLVSALAAGNRVMIKMSEFTPRFAELFAQLIGDAFAPDHVAVVTGDVAIARAFAGKPFDHLLFTGSAAVGRQVMRAAAENLTPVTLELGGKSPAIIAPGFPVDEAARRIMWGKCLNAGQTCIAPDYVLLPEDQVPRFVEAAGDEVRRLYPDGAASADYTAIIDARHYRRLLGHLDDARAKGAQTITLAGGQSDSARKLPPTIVTGATSDMSVMQDEIFGPLLPLVPYRTLDAALGAVADRPRPLAMYYFDRDRARIARVMERSMAGGVTINDTMLHVAQDELPFGGVGASGMGHYHGEEGFNTFSKRKGVFVQPRRNALRLFKPPYGRRVERLLKLLLR